MSCATPRSGKFGTTTKLGRSLSIATNSSSIGSRTRVRERVDTAAHELFRIGEVVLVRGGAQAVGVRFLDDGTVNLGRELRVLAHAVVDPHFDDVDAERGLLAHAGAPFVGRRDPVRDLAAARLRRREAAARRAIERVPGDDLAAHRVDVVAVVLAQAHRGADAEVRAMLEIGREPRAIARQMRVRIDDRGHHGAAREVDGRRAGRHRHRCRSADQAEAIVGADRKGRVVDDGAIADEEPRAREYRDAGARGGRVSGCFGTCAGGFGACREHGECQ